MLWSENPGTTLAEFAGAAGIGTRRLTFDAAVERTPRISPDGRVIAFASNRSVKFEIWTINRDGSGLTQVISERRGGPEFELGVSPDQRAFSNASV